MKVSFNTYKESVQIDDFKNRKYCDFGIELFNLNIIPEDNAYFFDEHKELDPIYKELEEICW